MGARRRGRREKQLGRGGGDKGPPLDREQTVLKYPIRISQSPITSRGSESSDLGRRLKEEG